MRKTKGSGVADGPPERGISSNRHGAVEKPQISEAFAGHPWVWSLLDDVE
jgi:hypothetical protein